MSAVRMPGARVVHADAVAVESAETARRFMASAACREGATSLAAFHDWFGEVAAGRRVEVTRIPFARMSGWRFDEASGNLVHDSGRFFSIEGLSCRAPDAASGWLQPIIVQPEIGLLGILVKEIGGVLHCLMQAKMEPGNVNSYQLSPTVQATRSNYAGVHGGRRVTYLDYFTSRERSRVLVDSLQSEQGSWFLHKRNRNMVVEALDDVPPDPSYCWLTVGQVHELLQLDNVVNMDARTVLSCLPLAHAGRCEPATAATGFGASVQRSLVAPGGSLHRAGELLSWLTEMRMRHELVRRCVPLDRVGDDGWFRDEERIAHRSGRWFTIVAVDVRAGDREVTAWSQPLLAPGEAGLIAFLARTVDGTLHVLVRARAEAGALNGPELAPTVQCQPRNYAHLPPEDRPPYLDQVLSADPARIRYDARQSEEGGRFERAENRYVVVEVDDDFPLDCPDDFRWMTLHQLSGLLAHGNYVNVQARSLLACLGSLW